MTDDLKLPPGNAPKWQPIETAPKSGFFLVCSWESHKTEGYECSVSVVWPDSKGGFIAYLDEDNDELPYLDGPATHWMPFPEPPAAKEARGE